MFADIFELRSLFWWGKGFVGSPGGRNGRKVPTASRNHCRHIAGFSRVLSAPFFSGFVEEGRYLLRWFLVGKEIDKGKMEEG